MHKKFTINLHRIYEIEHIENVELIINRKYKNAGATLILQYLQNQITYKRQHSLKYATMFSL